MPTRIQVGCDGERDVMLDLIIRCPSLYPSISEVFLYRKLTWMVSVLIVMLGIPFPGGIEKFGIFIELVNYPVYIQIAILGRCVF